MKNKGFTLIELLAIIIIIAIITLITMPIVKNVIDQSKEKAAVNSAYGFKDALHNYYINSTLDDETELEGIYRINDGVIDGPNLSSVSISLKGTKPSAGKVVYKNGNILIACLEINGYKVKYRDEQFISEGKGSCDASAANFATDSWAEIKFNLEADRNAYPIGSLKTVKMNLTGEEKEYTLRLINTSHPAECDTRDVAGNMTFSQTGCGVVIEFVTIIETRAMNESQNNTGYTATSLRTHLNTDDDSIYNKLPDDLKAVIIETSPMVSGGVNKALYSYGEKLFPLGIKEVNMSSGTDLSSSYTRVLDFYVDNNNNNARKKYTATNKVEPQKYYSRSARKEYSSQYHSITSSGGWTYEGSITDSTFGISAAFRIAE